MRRKLDLHVQFCDTVLFRKGMVNIGVRMYKKVPDNIKKTDNFKSFKTELKSFLLHHAFYSPLSLCHSDFSGL